MIRFNLHSALRCVAGLLAALLMCGAVAAAILHSSGAFERDWVQAWETRLHASAAQASGSLAIATGPIEAGLDGIFVLDGISGELTCGVLNPRTRQVAGLFRRNIAADLGVVPGRQPRYLMVTGNMEIPSAVTNTRPALSVLYVADATSGRYAAYSLLWNQQVLNQNLAQVQPIYLIGGGSARNVVIE